MPCSPLTNCCSLLLLLLGVINVWIPGKKYDHFRCSYTACYSNIFIKAGSMALKSRWLFLATMVFTFFLLNTNFYPQLLTYQIGNELA
jgi:hypothetical protein